MIVHAQKQLVKYKVLSFYATVLHHPANEFIDSVQYPPCVSMLIPFEPKMGHKSSINSRLAFALNKVKMILQNNYPDEKGAPVFHRLNTLFRNLNYNTNKKSIAVFF
jgi:hypothetical protein